MSAPQLLLSIGRGRGPGTGEEGAGAVARNLADQLVRAASSVPANLVERQGRSGRDRIRHQRITSATAREVDRHLRLLIQSGAMGPRLEVMKSFT